MQVGQIWNEVKLYWKGLEVSRHYHFSRTQCSSLLHSSHFKPRILRDLEAVLMCIRGWTYVMWNTSLGFCMCWGPGNSFPGHPGTRICEELRTARVGVWSRWPLCRAFVVDEANIGDAKGRWRQHPEAGGRWGSSEDKSLIGCMKGFILSPSIFYFWEFVSHSLFLPQVGDHCRKALEIIVFKMRAIIGKLYKAELEKQVKYTCQVQRTSRGDLV